MSTNRKRADSTDTHRWSKTLTVSAAVISCAFVALAVAVWQTTGNLIFSETRVETSRSLTALLDESESNFVDAQNSDAACVAGNDPRACNRARTDRLDMRRSMAYYYARSRDAEPDHIRDTRIQMIRNYLPTAAPRGKDAPDPYATSVIADALPSLARYEQLRLKHSLDGMKSASVDARQTMAWLLTIGLILLTLGQAALWTGIRDQRRAQERLEEVNANLTLARREALALSEAKGRFLADMSHEIRTPLNGIVGMVSMLSMRSLSPEDLELLRTIRASSDVLLRVVDDVLDLSKIDSNRVELRSEPLELNSLVRDVAALYKGMAHGRRNEILIQVPEDRVWVRGDSVRLKQIFGNLISNAVKFCREGQIVVNVSTSVRAVHTITVSDTGIGIEPSRLDQIFDEFVQAQIAVSQEHPGTGLGLAIAKKLASRMGGTISVTSEIGVGSTFTVEVPLAFCSPPPELRSPDLESLRGMRVLLAEDNNVNILVATAILQRAGCEVDVARDGIEATDRAVSGSYDFILMDLRMPKLQGTEATIQILNAFKDRDHAPKIVAMTANAASEDREACMAAGMVGFLSKPFTYEQLIEALGGAAAPSAAGESLRVLGGA